MTDLTDVEKPCLNCVFWGHVEMMQVGNETRGCANQLSDNYATLTQASDTCPQSTQWPQETGAVMLSPTKNNMTFEAWIAELDRVIHEDFNCAKGVPDTTGHECWRVYYDQYNTPTEAWTEDCSNA